MAPLNDYLKTTITRELDCLWALYEVVYTKEHTPATLAKTIADILVSARCPDVLYRKWLSVSEDGTKLSDREKMEIDVYLKPSIERSHPTGDDPLQAVIAEHLWYEIVRATNGANGLPIKISRPSLRVTEPGGDGLVVYQLEDSTYFFRLWEVKKHVSSSKPATIKIAEASKQLANNGAEYLAKVSKIGQEVDAHYPGLSEFYSKLVGMWLDADSKASAGVSVSKDDRNVISSKPIKIMKTHIPHFVEGQQLEGLFISIPDFAKLTKTVREELWKDI